MCKIISSVSICVSFWDYFRQKSSKKSKRKRKTSGSDEETLEATYAEQARSQPQEKKMRALLPIKTKDAGVVPQMIEDDDSEAGAWTGNIIKPQLHVYMYF